MARKIKKKKEHGNHSLQSQISYFADVDLRPFRLEYLELQKSIWCKLYFFGFLTRRPITIPNVSRAKSSYETNMIFIRWHMNYANKQVLWRNKSKVLLKASKLSCKYLFQKFSSSKSKVKTWRFYTRLFLLF